MPEKRSRGGSPKPAYGATYAHGASSGACVSWSARYMKSGLAPGRVSCASTTRTASAAKSSPVYVPLRPRRAPVVGRKGPGPRLQVADAKASLAGWSPPSWLTKKHLW